MELLDTKNIKDLANFLRCKPEFLGQILENGYKVISYLSEISAYEFVNDPLLVQMYLKRKHGKYGGKRKIYVPIAKRLKDVLKLFD